MPDNVPVRPTKVAWQYVVAGARAALGAPTDRRLSKRGRLQPEKKIKVYEATADASGGEVTVKWVESDGTTVGDTITLKVLP